ncbi:hypothetical protein LPJ53_004868 [Coemansia erecta]|uniref:5-formyltetrahydrofolate cyclo-ligase n=1 Tax=Coemansia erecta TaxID=147472 RepID=A0A9W8CQG1_9FUNG|nr:hypothetical protein LPJ53_004868 [Coemansia erecta]
MSATAAAKRQLRKLMHQRLAPLPTQTLLDQSSLVLAHLTRLPAYQASRHISIYISMPTGELQTHKLLTHALSQGKCVYVPRCRGQSTMDMVRIRDQQELDALERNRWGIPEPGEEKEMVDPRLLDFVVVPGVAFDREGRRCGHGKGYYDRFLAKADGAVACAVCLEEQVVESVPTDAFDRTPDYVIAPEGIIFKK